MMLRGLMRKYPDQFYPQDWYRGEQFLNGLVGPQIIARASELGFTNALPLHQLDANGALPNAATVAALYLADPTAPIWKQYLWTSDMDRDGQRVYCGTNGKGFEIHRHIHLTKRFGVILWTR